MIRALRLRSSPLCQLYFSHQIAIWHGRTRCSRGTIETEIKTPLTGHGAVRTDVFTCRDVSIREFVAPVRDNSLYLGLERGLIKRNVCSVPEFQKKKTEFADHGVSIPLRILTSSMLPSCLRGIALLFTLLHYCLYYYISFIMC